MTVTTQPPDTSPPGLAPEPPAPAPPAAPQRGTDARRPRRGFIARAFAGALAGALVAGSTDVVLQRGREQATVTVEIGERPASGQ
ncbi:MAG: hypothetical protein ACRDZS_02500 [Acidimicrobiales bacterium]